MELIDTVLKRGKQVIVLIPEIALTYQNVSRFYSRFGSCVSVINSRLSAGERLTSLKGQKGRNIDCYWPTLCIIYSFPKSGFDFN